jgi:hypothetical protein
MATHMKLLINVATGEVTAEAVIIENNTERPDPDKGNYKQGSDVDLNATHAHQPRPLGMLFYTDPKFGCVYYIGGQRFEVC